MTASQIEIHLNGEVQLLDQGLNLSELIAQQPVDMQQVAVEYNRTIIPRGQLAQIQLQSGDAVEIVEFIGGG